MDGSTMKALTCWKYQMPGSTSPILIFGSLLPMNIGRSGASVRMTSSNETATFEQINRQSSSWVPVCKPELLRNGRLGRWGVVDVAKRLSEAIPSCKVVQFSGRAAVDNMESGCVKAEVLQKPLHPLVLILRFDYR